MGSPYLYYSNTIINNIWLLVSPIWDTIDYNITINYQVPLIVYERTSILPLLIAINPWSYLKQGCNEILYDPLQMQHCVKSYTFCVKKNFATYIETNI